MSSEYSDTFLTTKKLAERWGKNPVTLERWRKTGVGPKFIRISRGKRSSILYRLSDVVAHEREGEEGRTLNRAAAKR